MSKSIEKPEDIRIEDFTYQLPDERIAKYPLQQRDRSKLLVYRDGMPEEHIFCQLPDLLPIGSLLVFNNTRVIRARLLFRKETGANIEIFCLEPASPRDYEQIFRQSGSCAWHCLVGNQKKWKTGALQRTLTFRGKPVVLTAERESGNSDSQIVAFRWDNAEMTFADVLEAVGVLPIPPYLHRETENADLQTYQTVYARIKGSVAAPTAGLHFTPEILQALDNKGFMRDEITLHVGAGTFRPVQSKTLGSHNMHTEHFVVRRDTILRLLNRKSPVVAVGTTSVRTLESLYYVGLMLVENPDITENELVVSQWAPYSTALPGISTEAALTQILDYLDRNRLDRLIAQTRLLIAPRFRFRLTDAMITNFHQPQSTLLLLVAAFAGEGWRRIYDFALANDFRFLSYGDSSLLFRHNLTE
ncbi:MAG: S-adenosylmethionine:tRNA ribosyltransferase-isomerase [Tannerella sp.]|jgi:S-adenosylmethionine:tRNA ribosyltransferase-isomerase|nr:S-adenosylmethionine:tRNA ribosyltransferase-isomerase [Tannerella sp.]